MGEIERGIFRQRKRDPSFAQELARWLDRVLAWYEDRVLAVDIPTARRWGQLSGALGHDSADLVIAATAVGCQNPISTLPTRKRGAIRPERAAPSGGRPAV